MKKNSWLLRPIVAAVGGCFSMSPVWANPTGPQVMHGAAQIQGLGSNHLKVTNTPGSIIHWQGFSIGAGQVTQFVQQSASSSVLNRVVGADISQIHGQLLSNGRVFLINPAGILIGAGAVIDTAGFVGSTLNMLDGDFLAGKLKFQGGEGAGSIVNQGWIKAGQGGNIVLVAPHIENSGIIQTEGGEIVLAAGHKMTIGSMELEGVQFEIQAPTDSVLNVGKLLADGGAVGVFASTLKHSGDIRANALTRDEAGRIVLKGKEDVTLTAGSTVKADGKAGGAVTVQSESGTTLVSGHVSATGSAGKGGDVRVLGERVGVFDAATLDASGTAAGGQILVGGDYLGRNPEVQNAWRTFVAPDATLRADAGNSGDGGKVIVWSDDTTRFNGTISARGGANSGDGGFIETSGKHSLMVGASARVDARAPAGKTGSWLLDPDDIDVNSPSATPLTAADQFADPGNVTIAAATINAAGADVTLQANNDISIFENITLAAGRSLTMQAGASITFDDSIITTNNGNVTLIANETTANGVIAANRGAGPAQIFMNNLSGINAQGSGSVVVRINTGAGHTGNSGNITLSNVAGQNVTVENLGPTAGSSIVRAAAGSLITSTASTTLNGAAIGAAAAPMRLAPGAGTVSSTSTGAGVNDGVFIQHPVGSGDIVLSRYTLSAVAGTAVTLTTGNDQITVDANLNLPGVNVTLNPSGTSESVVFSAASTVNANSLTLGGTRFTDFNSGAGIVDLNTPVTMNQQVQINGGTVNFNGASAISAGLEPRLTLAGGTLSGTNTLTVNGNALWSGGGMSGTGTTAVTGTLTMNGGAKTFGQRTLTVTGATTWSAGNVINVDGGIFNANGGLTISNALQWTGAGDATKINIPIAQTLTRNGTAGTVALDRATIDNFGGITLAANTGEFRLSSGASAAFTGNLGPVVTNAGSTLNLAGGTYSSIGAISGAGSVTVSGGDIQFGGSFSNATTLNVSGGLARFQVVQPLTPASVNVSGGTLLTAVPMSTAGGTLSGTGALSVANGGNTFTLTGGTFDWTGGTLNGVGTLTVNAPATLNISQAALHTMAGSAQISNSGTVNLTGGGELRATSGANVITNLGQWNAQNDFSLTAAGPGTFVFNNNATGTLTKTGAGTITGIAAAFNNAGAVNVTSGTLTLSGGGTDTTAFNVLPGALLNFGGGNHTVTAAITGAGGLTVSGGAFTTNAPVTLTGALTVSSGTATFNANATALTPASVTVSGGTAEFNRTLTDNGAFTLSGAGVARMNSDSTIAGAFNFSGGTLTGAGQVHANGGGTWTQGTLDGTGNGQLNLPAGQTLTLSGAGTKTLTSNAFLASDGTINWSGGTIDVTNGSQIVNGTTGVFAANGNTTMQVSGGAGTFTNNGIFRRAGAGSTAVNGALTFTSNATVDTQAGTLVFNTANASFANGSAFTGAGTTQLAAGGALAGAITSANLELAGGAFTGTWNIPGGSTVNWTGGTLNGAGTTTVSAGTPGGTFNISGNALKTVDNGHVLSIAGVANWTGGGDINIANGSQINTTAAGTFNAQVAQEIRMNTGTGTFNNAGLFQKTLDAGTTTVLADFNNTGAVNVDAGLLDLRGGTDTGDYGIAAGSTLQFRLGTRNLNAGVDITGPGTATVDFAGATVNLGAAFNQAVGAPKWLVRGGTISNTAGITLNDAFEWTGGTITGAGTLTTSATSTTTINGMAILNDSTWNNAGIINLAGVQIVLDGNGATPVVFTNSGTLNDTSTAVAPIVFGQTATNKTFANTGTFNKNAGSAATQTIALTTTNTGGTINVNSGTLQLNVFPTNAGTINLANNATLSTNGNDLASSGTIGGIGTLDLGGGLLTNSGTLRPGASPGTLNITGNLMMTGASVTNIEIQAPGTSPGTDYDVINVTGQVDFNGTLNVLHLGGFTPPAGANFTIFNYAASTGDFATKNFPIGYTYSTTVDPTSYILGVTSFQNIWIFAGDGQWTETAKWSLGRAPIATDDTVIPDRPGFNDTITVAAGNQAAGKLTASENLAITGGQLTLGAGPSATNANLDVGGGILIADGPLTANALSLSGGALQGTGAVTVANNFTFTGGILANTGGVTVAGNTIVSAGTPQVNGLLSTAVLDLNGATLGIGTGGILTLTGAGASQIVNGAVNNIGTFRFNTPANNLVIGNGGSFNNDPTGTFDIQNDLFVRGAGTGVFNNGGTFLKSGGTVAGSGGADATLRFNNNGGLINSQMGALRLTGGGDHTGPFLTAGNGVNLDGGVHTFAVGSSIDGPFVFLNGGATLVSNGLTVNSALTWNGPGTIHGTTLNIAPGGVLHIIAAGDHVLDGVVVNNQGTTNYNTPGNELLINNGSAFNNLAGGTFDIQGDLLAHVTAGAGTFSNTGAVLKSAGAGTGGFDATLPFTNHGGTLNAQMGTLEFAGMNAFNSGTQFIGVGNNVVSGNSAFNGTINSTNLTLQNGTFSGTADLVGTTAWTGGTMTGAFTVPMGSVLNLTGAVSKGINGTTLTNAGILALVGGGNLVLNNAGITNTGVLDIQSDADITQAATSTLANAGTLMKSGGAGTSSIGGPGFNMTNPGTLHVRSGTLEVNGLPTNAGALTIDAGTTFSTAGNPLLNQGGIRGNGTLELGGATLTNEALVAPGASPGTLLINGDFVQTPAGVLAIDLGGTNQGVTYDLLQITGNAVLDGILNVTTVGTFVPAAGNNFAFMTYNSHTGNFATFHFPAGTQFHASPGATAYAVISQSGFSGAGIETEQVSETRRLYDDFLEIIPEDRVEKPLREARICD